MQLITTTHAQRLIGEEMMKRRLIGNDQNMLLRGLLNSQNQPFLTSPAAVRGLTFDTSLLSQNFANNLTPFFALVNNINMNNSLASPTTDSPATTTTTKGTKSQRPSKPGLGTNLTWLTITTVPQIVIVVILKSYFDHRKFQKITE